MEVDNIFLDLLPKIDLHGFDKESAKVMTNDFIKESLLLGNYKIVIIHGIGKGIVKHSVHETLNNNKNVLSYKLDNMNIGCTIVNLKEEKTIKR